MSDVTRILSRIEEGDPSAAEQLLPLVYDELRKLAANRMAQERLDHTLQSTALVHEAYVRLLDRETVERWNSRGHFFAAAAEAMRRILVEHARRRGAEKRGGGRTRIDIDAIDLASHVEPDQLIAIDEALSQLAEDDPPAAELVKLRYFAGMSVVQAAEAMGVPTATAYRHWAYARAWLHAALVAGHG